MKNYTFRIAVLAISFLSATSFVNAQKITVTVTGSGVVGFSGDGGGAKNAVISGPKDVCIDAAQNIYFVDKGNGRIRKIDAVTGVINTIAGGGTSTTDGIPATDAMFSPNYMCMNAAGDIFFTAGPQVKKIAAATGIITTVAGTTVSGFSGDGGPAALAAFSNPQGIAVDVANNIYIVDRNNNRIRKITAATGIITTIAGTTIPGNSGDGGLATAAQIQGPVCVCVNPAGDVFFSDQNLHYPGYDNSVIRKISAATGIVTRVAGTVTTPTPYATFGVLAVNAILGTTTGMCIGPNGNLYCNEMSCSCRELDFATDTLRLLGGDFAIQSYSDDLSSPLANMNIPYGLCVDNAGSVYVADSNNQRIRKLIQLTHTPTFAYGRGRHFNPYTGVAYTLDSLLWITDMDAGETETWTVVSAPLHGTLAGFPATAPSNGTVRTTKPTGLSYTPDISYPGTDFFKVRVSDGVLSDTVTIYLGEITTPPPPPPPHTTLVSSSEAAVPTINIFPNPASSELNITWKDMQAGNAAIFITDITDRVFYNIPVSDSRKTGSMSIDIASLPAGSYIVRINDQQVRTFVKQ